MDDIKPLSTIKTFAAIFIALAIMVVAQSLSLLAADILIAAGAPTAAGNVVAGLFYPALAFVGVKFLCEKMLKSTLRACRLPRFSASPLWCCAAVVMPCLVSCAFLLTAGHWESRAPSLPEALGVVAGAVFFFGFGVGAVEEMIFRGVILSALEKRYNKYVAVLAPSLLFGLLHIIGNDLSWLSTLQLILAGSVVGILFSLVAIESGNVWNSAIMHGVWNMVIVGRVLHIGRANPSSLYSYVLDTDSFLLTGGDFGIEASVVSIAAYSVFILLAVFLIKRRAAPKAATAPTGRED